MVEQDTRQWMLDRGFQSCCRVCGCWQVQGHHWISYNPLAKTISEYSQGYFEDCIPSDNLEYLEWCLDHPRAKERIWTMY